MHQHLKKLLSLGMHLAKYMTLFYLQERALFSSLIVDPSWRVRCAKWQILFWKETRSSCFRKIYISIKWLHLRVINVIKNLSNVYLGDAMHFGRLFTDQFSVCVNHQLSPLFRKFHFSGLKGYLIPSWCYLHMLRLLS